MRAREARRIIENATPQTERGVKQYKYLYQKMLDDNIIRKAYKRLRKGKTKRKEIKYIDSHLDKEVEKMRTMIENTKPPGVPVEHPELAFRPKKHKEKHIFEHGKMRRIFMPEIHEQWLHHIIILVIEPIVVATAYAFSCGSFPGKGAHFAKRQLERWIKKAKNIKYFAKIDIRHFYDSVRQDILMRELAIRIKDDWFLHIIRVCLIQFKKGIPLGFYISQWLANYLLEPLDYLITRTLGFKIMERYMDDIVIMSDNKKKLRQAVVEIKMFIGRRFRLKLKRTHQVCRFIYDKGERILHGKKKRWLIGRQIDYMGFVFDRTKTIIRKSIMLSATRMATRLHKAKTEGRRYFSKHVQAMISYMGWFSWTNSYNCYRDRIKPYIRVGKLKKIVSRLDRRANNERVEKRALCLAA